MNVKHLIKRDSDGRAVSEIFADGDCCNFDNVEVSYKYDPEGNLSERSVFLSDSYSYATVTTYKYDAEKRPVSEVTEELFHGKAINEYSYHYAYDADGNLNRRIHRFGNSEFTSDYIFGAGGVIMQQKTAMNGGNKKVYDCFYDADGRLIRKKCTADSFCSAGRETEYFYDSDGNVIKETITNADNSQIFTEMCYSDGRVIKAVTSYSDTEAVREINYEYDSRGRKIRQTYINPYNEPITTRFIYDEYGSEIFSFVYDEKSRVTEINISRIKNECFRYSAECGQIIKQKTCYFDKPCQIFIYDYDSNGNMIKEMWNHCYSRKSSVTEKVYDEKNNLIKSIITSENGKSVIREYEYNSENILTEERLTDNNGKTVKWKYGYNSDCETVIEIDNTENAKYHIDECGDLFPAWN